ncbi:type III pantothenate kinase [Dechloromonas sp. XY25]|uniref:Type III pantothenate kinase n=1 Tax=Dechloromonas hankyongensis TaxID=2908002 RepID=A0ABS9JWY8_9RHOO|nr:type III pantothenate kinase [Dechloromonas hankyongensis]MCG2575421.1 type III pantothenate kinase [Dechloromonas hankyongensis]
MIVCLDSGNTRIKWGVHDGASWLAQGAVAHAEIEQLTTLASTWPRPERVMLANVAGPAAGGRIRQQLAAWQPVFHDVQSSARAGGVTNLYRHPERLGVDRWCALIGARALQAGPTVVVMAGTATTIDTLDVAGNFVGGDIVPGIGLMLRSLAQGTAGLPFADGHYAPQPRCTDDAIVSGVLEAQAGAIERVVARLDGASCLLSGGYAEQIAAVLHIPHRLVANLPLDGLRRLAGEMPLA